MTATALELAGAAALVAACAFGATFALARLAPRMAWRDAGDGGRKTQRAPLAPVGGVAIALSWIAACGLGEAWPSTCAGVRIWPWAGLAAALAVGLLDDALPRGLTPLRKLAGQALAGTVLVWPALLGAGADPARLAPALLIALGAVVAMNALNTWDNADGAAGGLGLCTLAPAAPLAAAALAGFLPANLRARDGRALLRGLNSAILGDAGSHLLALALWLEPATWPALLVPLADLARVAVARQRAGQAPWIGDRRHLAHRLERGGLSPLAVAIVLALVVLPSAWPAGIALRGGSPASAAAWGALSLALWAAACVATRSWSDPCRGTGVPG